MTTSKMGPHTLIVEADDGDFLRELIGSAAQCLMKLEVEAVAGAAYGERNSERQAHRNGYRERSWQTRAGKVGLQVPKLRQGSYFIPPHGPTAITAPNGRQSTGTLTSTG